ncbi:MAG: hypothetical protein ACRD01_00165 [Terriglobales bacterium]
MARRRFIPAIVAALLLLAAAGSSAASSPRLSEAQRIAIIQSLIAQVGIARRALPQDKKGVELSASTGAIMNAGEVASALDDHGPAAKLGARVAITSIVFKGDRIVFQINGGPHKTHWYNHVSISMGAGTSGVTPDQTGPHGAVITLRYANGVPSLTPEDVKKELNPLIDWDPPAKAEEMVKQLPPPVKAAINAHTVLVGMNTDMVVAALGRTGRKDRETNPQGQLYEDWIYGNPPGNVTFVRFIADRVVRVTVYHSNGTQTVDTTPLPALAAAAAQQQQQAAEREQQASEPKPTLRRPGDAPPPSAKPNQSPIIINPPMLPGQQGLPGQGLPGQQLPPGQTAPPTQGIPPTPPVVCCTAGH